MARKNNPDYPYGKVLRSLTLAEQIKQLLEDPPDKKIRTTRKEERCEGILKGTQIPVLFVFKIGSPYMIYTKREKDLETAYEKASELLLGEKSQRPRERSLAEMVAEKNARRYVR